jgi:hypothetical protein
MSPEQTNVLETLPQGTFVRILSPDVYPGRVGQIHFVYSHARANEFAYLVKFSSLYGADMIPFRRDEVAHWQEREGQS